MTGAAYNYIVTALLVVTASFSQNKNDEVTQLKKDVYYLASDALQGRAPGTQGAELAAEFIVNRFKEVGLKPFLGNSYQEPFTFQEEGNTISTENLFACTNPAKSKKLIITAHYDHLGLKSTHSREIFQNKIHNGADDNASGVALLLALADYFMEHESKFNYNIVFICFSGHESGLFGSADFVNKHKNEIKNTAFVLNFDMVGRLNKQEANPEILFRITDKSSWKEQDIPQSASGLKVRILSEEVTLDHTIFSTLGIPAATLSTGIHDDYHKATDDAAKINFEGIVKIKKYLETYCNKVLDIKT
ncbi:M28 family peptidase [Flavobacterium salilacus subsp. salilacus]|uniref:M28 family peptidase n=1 Tax=Flavobacterium TaxID=237 RepID=UPI001074E945|nr:MULTISPECIES: M28 family peptidase [Flavobacterium]KAF2515114.1 M28 family peptidase [Flavobacterium salilacus subsp. salilacus]MBE1615908.1 M28 family peptidase [Flavobacterium sp. SaA2.13]